MTSISETRAARMIETPGTNCHPVPAIARCKRCKSALRVTVNTWRSHAGYGRMQTNYEYPVLACACGTKNLPMITPIVARTSEHKCDSRCTNAVGPNCDCSCGGKNHGSGH